MTSKKKANPPANSEAAWPENSRGLLTVRAAVVFLGAAMCALVAGAGAPYDMGVAAVSPVVAGATAFASVALFLHKIIE